MKTIKQMKHWLSLVLLCAMALSVAGKAHAAPADLIGESVQGSLTFQEFQGNYFNSDNGFVPASGYSNSGTGSDTVTIAEPDVEFGFDNQYGNRHTANLTGTQLIIQSSSANGGGSSFTMNFTSAAFGSFTKVSDNYPNGGVTSSASGNTLTLNGTQFSDGTYTAVFNVGAPAAPAGLIGESVNGSLTFQGFQGNYFNQTTATIEEPDVEFTNVFGYSANFTGTQLIIQFNSTGGLAASTSQFTSFAFEGLSFTKVSDTFPNSSATPSASGNTLTVNLPEIEKLGLFTAVFNIGAAPVNTAPVASDSSVSTPEDTPLTIDLKDLVSDDSTADADLNFSTTGPGSVSLGQNGVVTFTPAQDFNGQVSFTYTATDSDELTSNTATVTITVMPVNDAPVLSNLETDALEYTATSGALPVTKTLQVADVDSATLLTAAVVITSNFTIGDVLAFTNDDATKYGNITGFYTANQGDLVLTSTGATATVAQFQAALRAVTFSTVPTLTAQTRTLVFQVNDDSDFSSNNLFRDINIALANTAPVVSDISVTATEDTAYTFAATDFDAGFSDGDEDALSAIQITSLPASGVLLLDGVNVEVDAIIARDDIDLLTYTPNSNYHSTDSFGWNGSDGTEYSAADALVNITVEEVNDNPTLDAIPTINGDEGALINFFARGEDVDTGTVLEYSLIGAPTGATINSVNGEFRWTPTETQGGQSYNFQIKVTDGEGGQALQNVTIVVAKSNTAPVLPFVGARTLYFGRTNSFSLAATDSDLPRNTLTYSLIGAPSGASINSSGLFSWTPSAAQSNNAFYQFKVKVTDNGTPAKSDEEFAYVTVQYPAEIMLTQYQVNLKADNTSRSMPFTYTVRNNTSVAYTNLKVTGDLFWPTNLQGVQLTAGSGTSASQSTLSASSRRVTWTIPSLPAYASRTLSVKLTGIVPSNAPVRSRIASGFVLAPASGSAIPNHTATEVFLNTYK